MVNFQDMFQIRNKAWNKTCVDAHHDANTPAKKVPKHFHCHNTGGNQVSTDPHILCHPPILFNAIRIAMVRTPTIYTHTLEHTHTRTYART